MTKTRAQAPDPVHETAPRPSASRNGIRAPNASPYTSSAIARAWARVEAALSPHPDCPLPAWQGGGTTADQCLLIIDDPRDGDTLRFIRLLAIAIKRFAKIGFVGPASTRRLIEWSFGDGIVTLARIPRDAADWDLRCSLATLPAALGTPAQMAASATPWVRIPQAAASHWRDRLAAGASHGLCVGLAWSGQSAALDDAQRGRHADDLAPLFGVSGVTWVNLKRWGAEGVRPHLPGRVDWIDWTEDLDDMADMAALVDNLDLVISTDSSALHLAGGLGVPVWQLGHLDEDDEMHLPGLASAGYRQMRSFRPSAPGSWDSVADPAAQALHAVASEFAGWTR